MNKGFTLIELLTVVLVIAILGLVTLPLIGGIINKAKEASYNEQIKFIEEQANKWSIRNANLIGNEYYVSLDTLMNDGFIDNDKLIDPRDDTTLKGCVKISYNATYSKYDYKYTKDCK